MSPSDRSAVETSPAEADSPSRGLGDNSAKPATARRLAPGGSLLPREHGAYAGIAFPLITALSLGAPTAVQLLWIAGCVAVFLAHEPLLIILGERGRRSHTALGARARKTAYGLAAFALATGGPGWWGGPLAAAAIFPFVLLAVAFSIVHVHPRHLRAMGWSLVGSNVITLIALLVGLR